MLSKEKASKADRPENSVLFSLKELRRLEDERVKAEANARRAQAEAERRAELEAEQRTRDEETRRAREEEERRRRAESEREERQREDRLRVGRSRAARAGRGRAEAEGAATTGGAETAACARASLREVRSGGGGRAVRGGRRGAGGVGVAAAPGGEEGTGAGNRQSRRSGAGAQLDFEAKIRALEEKAQRDVAEAKTAKDQARILGTSSVRSRPSKSVARGRRAGQRLCCSPPLPRRSPLSVCHRSQR